MPEHKNHHFDLSDVNNKSYKCPALPQPPKVTLIVHACKIRSTWCNSGFCFAVCCCTPSPNICMTHCCFAPHLTRPDPPSRPLVPLPSQANLNALYRASERCCPLPGTSIWGGMLVMIGLSTMPWNLLRSRCVTPPPPPPPPPALWNLLPSRCVRQAPRAHQSSLSRSHVAN